MANNATIDAYGYELTDAIRKCISSTNIVNYGIIKKLKSDCVASVEFSVSDKAENIVITDCLLVNIAGSSSFGVSITPKVNDKVLVLFPKNYSNEMFYPENDETIFTGINIGYSIIGGIAILCNTFTDYWFKNSVKVDEGTVELNLAYSEDDGKNLFTASVNEDGSFELNSNDLSVSVNSDMEVSLSTNGTDIKVDKDGYTTLKDSNSNEIKVNDSGITLNALNKTKVVMSSTDVKINGKLTVKA